MPVWYPRLNRPDSCREDVESTDVPPAPGLVTFNWLQQRELDTDERQLTPLEEAGGTDIWGITTG